MYNDGGVALTFTPPKPPSGKTIEDYEYDLSLDGGSSVWETERLGVTSSPGVAACPFGSTCTYRIRAVYGSGQSLTSGWKTVAAAPAPDLNRVAYRDGGMGLYFTKPSHPSGATIRDYEYDLSLDGGSSVWETERLGVTSSPGVAACPFGSTCTYRIRAVYDGGESKSSAWKTMVSVPPPTIKRVAFRDGGMGLYFAAPSSPAGATVKDDEYDLSLDGGSSVWETERLGVTSSPGVAACPFGSTCTYRIRAVYDGGNR